MSGGRGRAAQRPPVDGRVSSAGCSPCAKPSVRTANGSKRVLVAAADREASPQLEALARFARDRGAHVERLPRAELDRLTEGVHHQGAVALAPELEASGGSPICPIDPATLVVALDEVQDPQNFGAIIRSAVAMGRDRRRVAGAPVGAAARPRRSARRPARSSTRRCAACRRCRPRWTTCCARGVLVVGLDASADVHVDAVDLRGPSAIVVGAEGKGLRKDRQGRVRPPRAPADARPDRLPQRLRRRRDRALRGRPAARRPRDAHETSPAWRRAAARGAGTTGDGGRAPSLCWRSGLSISATRAASFTSAPRGSSVPAWKRAKPAYSKSCWTKPRLGLRVAVRHGRRGEVHLARRARRRASRRPAVRRPASSGPWTPAPAANCAIPARSSPPLPAASHATWTGRRARDRRPRRPRSRPRVAAARPRPAPP